MEPLSAALVDVAAVSDGDDEDEENLVADLVDDAVVAGADPPLAVPTDELLGSARTRLVCKQLDGRLDAAPRGGSSLRS